MNHAQTLDTTLRKEISNTIKGFTMDATRRANSGHPGAPMGTSMIATVLWTEHLRYDPTCPDWKNRDRFVLSCGHASMLLYTMLYLSGYGLTLDDIRNFRQLGSITPGHPEVGVTPGVEATTGPLGTGFAAAVGMAIGQRFLANRYNTQEFPVVDYRFYVLASDGDIMEGITSEAASIAGNQALSNIICLYDSNRITIDGPTSLTFDEDVCARFKAMNWHVQEVDGKDPIALSQAIERAKSDNRQPHFIQCHTCIGDGSPNTQDTNVCHGAPLEADEIALTKKALGWPDEEFYAPPSVMSFFAAEKERRIQERKSWDALYEQWKAVKPDLASEWDRDPVSINIDEALGRIVLPDKKSVATRSIIKDLVKISYQLCPTFMGGTADLSGSVKTEIKDIPALSKDNPMGRRIHFGIRENAMGAIINGLSLTRPFRGFCGTFLVFSDFMKPTIRLAALMELPIIYIFSHDSFAVGEDGPTHQPIEHVMNLRSIPNLSVIRPADIKETIGAWKLAWERKEGPTVIITTRQNIPILATSSTDISRGGYCIYEPDGTTTPDAIMTATGSEVAQAIVVARKFEEEGVKIRVISLPSWDIFERQPASYREQVYPKNVVKRISLEAGITLGWSKYAELTIGLDRFGVSGPYEQLIPYLGLSPDQIHRSISDYLAVP